MIDVISILILSIWLMLPAYIANPAAALFGGGTPVDMGKNFSDHKRILGDGKTYKGLVIGSLCGAIVGFLQIILAPNLAPYFNVSGYTMSQASFIALLTMPVGALLGDIVKSFFKRRLGYDRGAMLPIADQLDFVAGAWALTLILDYAWFTSNFTLPVIVTVLIITPVLHLGTNIVGFKLGKKKVPW